MLLREATLTMTAVYRHTISTQEAMTWRLDAWIHEHFEVSNSPGITWTSALVWHSINVCWLMPLSWLLLRMKPAPQHKLRLETLSWP